MPVLTLLWTALTESGIKFLGQLYINSRNRKLLILPHFKGKGLYSKMHTRDMKPGIHYAIFPRDCRLAGILLDIFSDSIHTKIEPHMKVT